MIDAKKLSGISGAKYLASVPDGETILNMTVFKDQLFIATDSNLYVLTDDKRLEGISEGK